jgi:hypothetical protein
MDGSAPKNSAANQPSGTGGELTPRPVDTLPISTDKPIRTEEPEPGPGGPSAPVVRVDRGGRDEPRRMPRGLGAALVIGVLLISGALALNLTTGALDRLNPFRNGFLKQENVDRSGPAMLKAINDLGDFRAASGYYELVVDVEKDVKPVPSFLAGQRTLFIAAGTVEVGVDLRGLDADKIKVNDDRTSATITLPAPTLSAPNVNTERSYIYSRQRGLIDRLKDAVGDGTSDQKELYTLASQRLAQAASQTDELRLRAEANTRSMMQGLLRSLGFTDVTINFSPPEG